MSLSRRTAMFTVLIALVLTLAPSAAFAAAPATDMWGMGKVDLADLAPGKEPTYIISLQLKDKVKLPTKVAVPLPQDATPIWAGEVFFADPKMDIVASDAKIVRDGKQRYLEFTMTKSRAVQVECMVASDMFESKGATADTKVYWNAPAIPGTVRIAIVVPTGYMAEVKPEKVEVLKASDGAAYVRTYPKTKAGQRLELELTMVAGQPVFDEVKGPEGSEGSTESAMASQSATASAPVTAVVAPGSPDAPATDWLFIGVMGAVVALLIAAVGALVVIMRRQGQQ